MAQFQCMDARLDTLSMKLYQVNTCVGHIARRQARLGGFVKSPSPPPEVDDRGTGAILDSSCSGFKLGLYGTSETECVTWQPPPSSVYKLNFDAAIFSDLDRTGVGAIIRDEHGQVMAAMTASGPKVSSSMEAELLACRRAMEFAVDAGFNKLIIEGDNVNVMQAISSTRIDCSLLGYVVDDIRHLVYCLEWARISTTRRDGNKVVHALAQHARNSLDNDVYWMEDSPPPAVEALIHDVLLL
ncbi:uncharacterized protein LOC142625029 [Castanea sativa]|uniref:uncharacterized protein LOC142625029 n=1 Tax=Castanea sativa TaxID=21020 RepID=UPI003F653CBF